MGSLVEVGMAPSCSSLLQLLPSVGPQEGVYGLKRMNSSSLMCSASLRSNEQTKPNCFIANKGGSCSGERQMMPLVTSSFLFLVVRPGATRSVLAPSSDALCY